MKAWRLNGLGGELALKQVAEPVVRAGSVLVRIETSVLMSYLRAYVEKKLPAYNPPPGEFTLGTNAIGIIEQVGQDVWHLKRGQRVVLSSLLMARENVDEPNHILIALTSGAGGEQMLADWPDGTLAELALYPVESVTPLDGLEHLDAARLAALPRCIVPFGGLLRARLAPGETVIINGASGAYGAAAVMVALAMGAGRIVAAGRDRDKLDVVARAAGERVTPVALKGDMTSDIAALKAACTGGAHCALDMIGNARDPNATLAVLHSLRRRGRMVAMGSMTCALPVPYMALMLNSWELIGNFMYPADAYRRLIDLLRAGLLDLSPFQPQEYAFEALAEAMDRAARASSFEYIVVRP
jgi:alcohol dehydrogenase